MNYSQLLAHFTTNSTHWGDNHGNLAEHVKDFINDYYSDKLDQVVDMDELSDNLAQYADNSTPIYYNNIAEWFAKNWNAVNEYVQDIGIPDARKFDIMRTIQAAYCYTLENEMRELIQETVDNYDPHYIDPENVPF